MSRAHAHVPHELRVGGEAGYPITIGPGLIDESSEAHEGFWKT